MISVSVLFEKEEPMGIFCFILKEGENVVSTAKVRLVENYVEILNIEWNNGIQKYEMMLLLIKAIANFAINRCIFVLACCNINLFDDLICFGFKKDKSNVNINVLNIIDTCMK